jgi:dTDP-4-dehydrorhamnose 3,5-epimerase
MKFISTEIPDVVLIEPIVYADHRGWFTESFNERRFHEGLEKMGLPKPAPFVQDNHSCSLKGVLRGLHYQLPPHAQGKMVRVVQGSAFDVAVDIRRKSPTFGRWVGFELSADNKRQLWIPPGFAHGFIALEDNTHFLYKTTDYYSKESEACILWNDMQLNIQWPLPNSVIQVAQKDAQAPLLAEATVFH